MTTAEHVKIVNDVSLSQRPTLPAARDKARASSASRDRVSDRGSANFASHPRYHTRTMRYRQTTIYYSEGSGSFRRGCETSGRGCAPHRGCERVHRGCESVGGILSAGTEGDCSGSGSVGVEIKQMSTD